MYLTFVTSKKELLQKSEVTQYLEGMEILRKETLVYLRNCRLRIIKTRNLVNHSKLKLNITNALVCQILMLNRKDML